MPCAAVGAGEVAAAAEVRATGTLGPTPAAAAGKAPTVGKLGPAAELGLVALVASGVEVPTGGVGP